MRELSIVSPEFQQLMEQNVGPAWSSNPPQTDALTAACFLTASAPCKAILIKSQSDAAFQAFSACEYYTTDVCTYIPLAERKIENGAESLKESIIGPQNVCTGNYPHGVPPNTPNDPSYGPHYDMPPQQNEIIPKQPAPGSSTQPPVVPRKKPSN